jgi:hypothetical protein
MFGNLNSIGGLRLPTLLKEKTDDALHCSRRVEYVAALVDAYQDIVILKTWGYQARQSSVPLELIMAKINHSNIAMTKRYLGITYDELRAIAEGLNL